MKKVLIALDYDPGAKKVAEAGYKLAKTMNAGIVILNVVSDEVYYSSLEYSPITEFSGFSNADFSIMINNEGITKASEFFVNSIKTYLNDDSIEVLIEKGDFSGTILMVAETINADVIVMGSHGRRGLDHILMGSVTEKVLHHTTIPLFIVPVKGETKDLP
ncbi:MAG TPA: universal stress protein [Bacteroidales bacterium]|nr:universal stress protein [Bacteroidales bacterium]